MKVGAYSGNRPNIHDPTLPSIDRKEGEREKEKESSRKWDVGIDLPDGSSHRR